MQKTKCCPTKILLEAVRVYRGWKLEEVNNGGLVQASGRGHREKWADFEGPLGKLRKKLLNIILSFLLQMTESAVKIGSRKIHLRGMGIVGSGWAGSHIWKLFVWFEIFSEGAHIHHIKHTPVQPPRVPGRRGG